MGERPPPLETGPEQRLPLSEAAAGRRAKPAIRDGARPKTAPMRRGPLGRLWRRLGQWIASFVLLSVLWPMLYSVLPVPVTVTMISGLFDGHGISKDWVAIEEMPADLIRAAIAAEDANFCAHDGFDFEAIRKAWEKLQAGSGNLKGGSTISMQTAKNAFLWQKRDWTRKGLEAYFTVLIELFWSKQRIMEIYLNIAEFGPGVYGVGAASRDFFDKDVSELTRKEAARLAAVLPNPREWSAAEPGPYVRERTASLMGRLQDVADYGSAVCPPLWGEAAAP